jgi:hypothetical protein
MFPGNIGEGISSDADVKRARKANRIIAPLILIHVQWLF